jgi:hypothetical protein
VTTAEKTLAEIAEVCIAQYVDWMHFHEVAMAEPFRAEREAQEFARRILSLADPDVLEAPPLNDGASDPRPDPRTHPEFWTE